MKYQFDSGLTLVLEENHAAPVVAFQAWMKVGAADEPPALAGVAHVFEHMLFKGTKRRGVGQIAQEVEGAGGEINAWTSYDETVYHVVMASPFFDTGLDILADALINSSFDPAELERERKVVLEEIKQGQDDPDRTAAQGLFRVAFDKHPYGRPVIGSADTVGRMRREDLLSFFAKNYVAANLTLVIVGDFVTETARAAVAKAFKTMPAGKPTGPRQPEPPQKALRVEAVARDVKETQMLFGFRVPDVNHEDMAALDLLAVVLGQGESSRLNLEVVRNRQLVTSTSSYVFSARDPGLLVVGTTLAPGRVDEAARAILDETFRLSRQEISPEELAKARTILESDRVYGKETVQGYARKLGFFASVTGDIYFEDRYFERLERLSARDLMAAAARYFRPELLTLYVQIPEAKTDRQADRAATAVKRLRPVVEKAAERAIRARQRLASVPAEDKVVRQVLPSGLTVLVLRDPSVPILALRAAWVGGQRIEDARSAGISNMLAALLSRGTKTRSAEQIMAAVEGMAGSLGGFSGRNSLGLQAEFLAKYWDKGLDLVADCLLNATFSEDEIEKERRLVIEDLRAQDDNLGQAVFQLFHSTLWRTHPYRLEPAGSSETVSSLTRRKLVTHFREHYNAANLTIAIVGDVDPDQVMAHLQGLFPEGDGRRLSIPAAPAVEVPREEPVQVFKYLAREQAHIVVGYPGTTLKDKDRFPLEILSQVLSGQGGRLFVEIREKRGLAYRVSAFSMEGLDPGYFAVYVAASPTHLDEALASIHSELKAIVDGGISADELARAQRYLVGSHAIGLQRKSAVAATMAFHEAYGQGWRTYRQYTDEIERVKLADVLRVARKYLDPHREVVAVVRPPEPTPPKPPRK